MRVLIRSDASLEIGTGHIMRCAALGLRLQSFGAEIHFACSTLPSELLEWLRTRGMYVHMINQNVLSDFATDLLECVHIAKRLVKIKLLVVDHYSLDQVWERGMRPHVERILVVDDLANRDHECDILLDQNLRRSATTRYADHIPANAFQFLGPRFALLRPEFDSPALQRRRDGVLRKLLVFFGGTDPGNQSLKVIDALKLLRENAPTTTLVLGPAHPQRELVHRHAKGMECLTVLDSTDEMSILMSNADLAIGTCGVAAWERCALGLPSLVVVSAENQREDAEILHEIGAIDNLGDADTVEASHWASALLSLLHNPARLLAMGLASGEVVDERLTALSKLESALFND